LKTPKFAIGMLLALGALSAQAGSFTATDSTYLTFDNTSGMVSLLPVFPGGLVTDVNISIDFGKCNDPAMASGSSTCSVGGEEFASEIFFYLVAPDGTRVDLVYTYAALGAGSGNVAKLDGTYPNALNGDGRFLVTFDDEAVSAVGPTMISASFRPEELLSSFDHAMPAGSWVLHMGDSVAQDPLSYFSACLQVTTEGGPDSGAGCVGIQQVPEPGSLPISLLGFTLIGGLELLRRRSLPARQQQVSMPA
jgi:hypothetical protein